MDAEAERIAAEEDAAWLELHATFELIPPDRFEEPRLTPEGWSPKDAMFHVAAWCAEAANQLEEMRLGTYVDPQIISDEKNREWFEISKGLDAPTVRAEFHASRTKMRHQWSALSEGTPPNADAVEWFEESGHLHYRGHRADLLTWLGRD